MRVLLILLATLAGVVVVLLLLGAAMYFRILPVPDALLNLLSGTDPPEHSAGYYPDDTLAYAWLTLAPGQGQLEQSRDIWDRFNDIREFRRRVDDLQDGFEYDSGIDFDQDVEPWIGPDLSVAFIDWDHRLGRPLLAGTIGVREHEAAYEFLQKWLDYMEDEEGADFADDSYQDFDIWVDENQMQAYGISDRIMVFATDEGLLEEVIDGINGNVAETLADSERFMEARNALPSRRFFSLYVDYHESLEVFDEAFDEEREGFNIRDTIESSPEWIMSSATWQDRAIVIDSRMPLGLDETLETPDLNPPADILPYDTLGLIAFTFDPDIDNWRDYLSQHKLSDFLDDNAIDDLNREIENLEHQYDVDELPEVGRRSGLDIFIDIAIELVEQETLINLEEDLFDHLQGEVSIAAWDWVGIEEEQDLEDNPGGAVMLIPHVEGAEEELADTMEKAEEYIENTVGIRFRPVDVGAARDAQVYRSNGLPFSPGYVLDGSYLIFGINEDSLADTVELQEEGGDTLGENNEYQRAVGYLPGETQFLAYANLDMIVEYSGPGSNELPADLVEICQESLAAFALSIYTPGKGQGGGMNRFTATLTLFPE